MCITVCRLIPNVSRSYYLTQHTVRSSRVVLTRDGREWLFTFPLPPIPVQWIPIPSHSHSQFCHQFQSLSHGIPIPIGNPIPMVISSTYVGCRRRPTSRPGRVWCRSVSSGSVRWRRCVVGRTSHSSVRGSCRCTPDGSPSPTSSSSSSSSVVGRLLCNASRQNWRSTGAAKHAARSDAVDSLRKHPGM